MAKVRFRVPESADEFEWMMQEMLVGARHPYSMPFMVCYPCLEIVARKMFSPNLLPQTFESPGRVDSKMSDATDFTNEELLAYVDERLPSPRATEIERQLRVSADLVNRLGMLLQTVERGDVTLGGMWRRGRWSCPPRGVWAAFTGGRLGDGLTQYLQFHLETVGCRICEASVRDLRWNSGDDDDRVRKIFQSSAGRLRPETR